ncbi:hypothetical protein G6F64_014952 [Rhizopus arrhizus]|uniref:Uncharacterized protein n=1 Tax=Rhizopus oryzae TaxID=64495 RepID=A0A9P6WSG7_RHIOR|nr:hypothetical protein G6F64_014952 [Rhizopus arrhizus]
MTTLVAGLGGQHSLYGGARRGDDGIGKQRGSPSGITMDAIDLDRVVSGAPSGDVGNTARGVRFRCECHVE